MNDDKFIPLREACKFTGLTTTTLRKWAKTDKIKTYQTPSGQYLYDKQNILQITNQFSNSKEKQKIIYCRVSSKKQMEDLERQCSQLQEQFPNYKLITDCASGINWNRKGLQTILELALQRELGELVVAHKDRLARFGFELIEWIINKTGGTIKVLDEENKSSGEQELAEDLLSIVHIYSCKQMGRRRYNKNT